MRGARSWFTADNYLAMAFAGGMTMAALAHLLSMPGDGFQIVGTFVAFVACVIWTVRS